MIVKLKIREGLFQALVPESPAVHVNMATGAGADGGADG